MDSVRGSVIPNLGLNLDQDLSNDGSRLLVQGARGLKPCPMAGFFTPLETSAAHNGDESYSFFSERAF